MGAFDLDSNMDTHQTQEKMMELLAKALPHFRNQLNLSQQEFGEKIGVTRQTVSSIERGEYQMTWSVFLAIIYFLKVNNGAIKPENMTDVDKFLQIKTDGSKGEQS